MVGRNFKNRESRIGKKSPNASQGICTSGKITASDVQSPVRPCAAAPFLQARLAFPGRVQRNSMDDPNAEEELDADDT
ncbi:uncharacterized protein SPSK_03798 [Sporothrix schenckii 1099-18]|uniref:Uncharacterized protein n=1 Tax=Sporothrix schenckii 1099-18 TaxID=1397361 RepID=A0A0F2M0U8_SPOSC|nr:uncharacterized protein SPSK_03798 [Sporothrix schenckii 1099-18]KJR82704.1 hypothetical protein SPSK_03798 [Sporothrix schenckii 1099-18]